MQKLSSLELKKIAGGGRRQIVGQCAKNIGFGAAIGAAAGSVKGVAFGLEIGAVGGAVLGANMGAIKGGTNWGAVGSFATQNIKFPKRKKR